jgi:hypothetical protein
MVIVNIFLWTILALVALLAMEMIKAYQVAEKEHARQMRAIYRSFAAEGRSAATMKAMSVGVDRNRVRAPAGRPAYESNSFFKLQYKSVDDDRIAVDYILPSRKGLTPAREIEGASSNVFCA